LTGTTGRIQISKTCERRAMFGEGKNDAPGWVKNSIYE